MNNSNNQADIFRRIDIANGHQPLSIDLYQNRGFGSSSHRDNTIQIHGANKPLDQDEIQNQPSPDTARLIRFWRRKLNLYYLLEDSQERDSK